MVHLSLSACCAVNAFVISEYCRIVPLWERRRHEVRAVSSGIYFLDSESQAFGTVWCWLPPLTHITEVCSGELLEKRCEHLAVCNRAVRTGLVSTLCATNFERRASEGSYVALPSDRSTVMKFRQQSREDDLLGA